MDDSWIVTVVGYSADPSASAQVISCPRERDRKSRPPSTSLYSCYLVWAQEWSFLPDSKPRLVPSALRFTTPRFMSRTKGERAERERERREAGLGAKVWTLALCLAWCCIANGQYCSRISAVLARADKSVRGFHMAQRD